MKEEQREEEGGREDLNRSLSRNASSSRTKSDVKGTGRSNCVQFLFCFCLLSFNCCSTPSN